MKKIIIFFLVCSLLFVEAKAFQTSAKSAVLIDAETNRIIYEKNAHEKLPMASTTKIITAITAIENRNLDDVVTVSKKASTTEGSSVWLSEGEKLTLIDLLYALMLESGNDAAVAIAEHIGGTEEEFLKMMNKTCKKAGALNTNCVTTNGLDADLHYTTALDLAYISSYAMQNEKFREIVATEQKNIPWAGSEWDRSLKNHNKLLWMYDKSDGIKTGYTKKSGRCLVSSAQDNGIRLIGVTLNASDDWNDHIKMFDYAFSAFKEKEVVFDKNQSLGEIKVDGYSQKTISYSPKEEHSFLKLYEKTDYIIEKDIPKSIVAPVNKGDKIGTATVKFSNGFTRSVDLIADENAIIDDNLYLLKEKFKQTLSVLLNLVR